MNKSGLGVIQVNSIYIYLYTRHECRVEVQNARQCRNFLTPSVLGYVFHILFCLLFGRFRITSEAYVKIIIVKTGH